MSGTAALCYPYKAVQLSQAEYNWVKDKLTELYDSQTTEKKDSSTEPVPGKVSLRQLVGLENVDFSSGKDGEEKWGPSLSYITY